jgi:opacity protein-like surface antigen
LKPITIAAACLLACTWTSQALAAAPAEIDPLALESAPVADSAASGSGMKLFAEAALGSQQRRYGLSTQTYSRLSLDYAQTFRLGSGWRAVLSNRFDAFDPPAPGSDQRVVNSLREAYAAWGSPGGETSVEFGRINVRTGPAYGYNPTDFFRAGSLRTATSVDPIKLRQNRLGTVMLRGQRQWGDHTVSLALAPKLESTPSSSSFDLDLGSTNHRHRALASLGSRWSERFSTQLLAFGEKDGSSQIGANATALLSDAAVGYAEWSRGRARSSASMVGLDAPQRSSRDRLAAGVTLALPAKVSLTVEYSYNGFGLSEAEWQASRALGPAVLGGLLQSTLVRQEQFSRNAWTVYATQQGGLMRKLDLTALVRLNGVDHSQLVWLEARHHWDGFDGALQALWSRGNALTEYGLPTVKSSLQAVSVWYF